MNKQVPWDKEIALERIRGCLDREGPLLPILHALQEEFGYIDEAAEPLIAEALNITRAEVHGVISFYHDFRRAPAGRHVLKLCRAEACQAAGGDPLAAHAEARLGVPMGTTAPDGSVTLGGGLLPRSVRGRAFGDARRPRGRPAGPGALGRLAGGDPAMTLRLYIPIDAAALAVGAGQVASAISAAAARQKVAIEVVRTGSRGLYWLEPMVEVETPGGRVAYGPVAPHDAESLLAALRADGAHKLRLGPTEDIPWLKRQTRLTFARCGIVDPRSLDDYRAHGGGKGLERALSLGADAIVEEVVQSGLRGRGGAGFPTGIKWRTVAQTKAEQKYIVCNADEGDSGTFADRMIMEGDPFVLIEGMTIAGIATGATKGYVYIRSEYPHAIAAMEAAIVAARRGGLLGNRVGGSSFAFDMEVRVGAGAYVCGEETSLLDSLEGKRGQVRAKPPLPAHQGPVRPADRHQQRALVRVGADHPGQGRSLLSRLRHGPLARHDADPACRQHQAWRPVRDRFRHHARRTGRRYRRRHALPAARSAPCRSAARSAPISRARCSIRRSTTKRSPRATA